VLFSEGGRGGCWEVDVANGEASPQSMRVRLPIFVHSAIDDMGLSLGAFRVYGHLARRAGLNNSAWPSYTSIGEQCFRASYPTAKSDTLRRKAIAAVSELKKKGLVDVQQRKIGNTEGNKSNVYSLVPLDQWLHKRDEIIREKKAKTEDLPF
jgi:hypothetical protein